MRRVRDRKDLNDFRVLYFATHALLPMPDACLPEPALVTSATGVGSDGLLEASDILDLKLDADLVVLSACDTGGAGSADVSSSGLQGGGEALGGLTRAMIYAGARGLIVSHWSVDSAATVRLMTELFSSGAPGRGGGPAARSARHAATGEMVPPLLLGALHRRRRRRPADPHRGGGDGGGAVRSAPPWRSETRRTCCTSAASTFATRTVRLWWRRFEPMFASEIRKKRVEAMRQDTHWR